MLATVDRSETATPVGDQQGSGYQATGWQTDRISSNYHNILGSCYVEAQSYLANCQDTEVLALELGERAATHLIIDTQMLKTERELFESDGWWGNASNV